MNTFPNTLTSATFISTTCLDSVVGWVLLEADTERVYYAAYLLEGAPGVKR